MLQLPLSAFAPVLGCPLNVLWVNPSLPLDHGSCVSFQHFFCETHDVLALVVLHQVHVLQCRYHVLLTDACLLADLTVTQEDKFAFCLIEIQKKQSKRTGTTDGDLHSTTCIVLGGRGMRGAIMISTSSLILRIPLNTHTGKPWSTQNN